MTAPLFIVEPGLLDAGGSVTVSGDEGRHAVTVKRLAVGEEILLSDGRGSLARAVVSAVQGKDTFVADLVERQAKPAPQPRITVVQALPKGDRGEVAVETMTEVGVDRIVPWAAQRCITVWKADRAAKSHARWASTARESAKQSRRAWHPEVAPLSRTEDVIDLVRTADVALLLHESAATPISAADVPAEGEVLLVVGPEGGLTEGEVSAFEEAGARTVRLGPEVLRTSTAGTVAAAVLMSHTSRWKF